MKWRGLLARRIRVAAFCDMSYLNVEALQGSIADTEHVKVIIPSMLFVQIQVT